LMVFLQPVDIGRNRRRACLDAAVIGLDIRLGRDGLACGIVEISADIIVERALIALQSQRIVATLIDDLLSDRTLAVSARRRSRSRPSTTASSSNVGTAVISLDLASVAICASTMRCSQPQAADHVQGRLAVGAIERSAQHFAIYRHPHPDIVRRNSP